MSDSEQMFVLQCCSSKGLSKGMRKHGRLILLTLSTWLSVQGAGAAAVVHHAVRPQPATGKTGSGVAKTATQTIPPTGVARHDLESHTTESMVVHTNV